MKLKLFLLGLVCLFLLGCSDVDVRKVKTNLKGYFPNTKYKIYILNETSYNIEYIVVDSAGNVWSVESCPPPLGHWGYSDIDIKPLKETNK